MLEEEQKYFDKDIKRVKYLFIVILLLIVGVFFTLQTCSNNKYHELKGEYTILKENYQKQKDGVIVAEINRLEKKKFFDSEIKKRELVNVKLSSDNLILQKKIDALKSKKFIVPKDAIQLKEYFNKRYKTEENSILEDKIKMALETAQDIAIELEEGDQCLDIIPLKDKQINNQETIITNLGFDKKDLKIQLTFAEDEIQKRKELQTIGEKNLLNLEDQIKKLNNSKTIDKIAIVGSTIIGGIIGYQIAK